jgi:hypothetical protein
MLISEQTYEATPAAYCLLIVYMFYDACLPDSNCYKYKIAESQSRRENIQSSNLAGKTWLLRLNQNTLIDTQEHEAHFVLSELLLISLNKKEKCVPYFIINS